MSIHFATITQAIDATAAAVTTGIAAWIAGRALKTNDLMAQATAAQANATADAAQATADAARAAEASAQSSDAAAKIAETLARIEIDRRHDEMFPDVQVEFRWERSMRTVQFNLFAYVANRSPRDYTVEARVTWDTNSSSNAGTPRLGAGQIIKIDVGDSVTNLPTGLDLDFDAIDPCPCPRGTPSGRHWARRFAVPQDRPKEPATVTSAGRPGSRL